MYSFFYSDRFRLRRCRLRLPRGVPLGTLEVPRAQSDDSELRSVAGKREIAGRVIIARSLTD